MQEPRGQELIDRYKQLYGDFGDIEITEEMILRHWELEKALTKELLESIPETRWETFDRCYTTLYSELPWLNQFTEAQAKRPDAQNFGHWLQLIGSPPKEFSKSVQAEASSSDIWLNVVTNAKEQRLLENVESDGSRILQTSPGAILMAFIWRILSLKSGM